MSRAKERQLLLLIVFAATVVGAWAYFESQKAPPMKDGGLAPPIAIRTPQGVVSLDQLKGKVVLVDFWATWCGPCRMSIPGVEQMYQKHHARGLEVLGVSIDTDPSGIPDFVRDMKMTYPAGQVIDPQLANAYDIGSIPLTVLVDRKGHVRWKQSGFSPELEVALEETIKKLLEE